MKVFTTFTAAVVLSFAAVHSADAADIGGHPNAVRVQFADLDLDTPEGAATLMRRIRSAAEQVCGPPEKPLPQWSRHRACIKFAVSTAVATVDRPVVSEYLVNASAKSASAISGHSAGDR
jgi:UrcA family protein